MIRQAGSMAQVVECLPSKHKAEFNPLYHKKQNKKVLLEVLGWWTGSSGRMCAIKT
jgi:hypothetical protein